MKILEFILDLIISPSSDMMKERYIKKYGYPDENKIFVDNRGNITSIIGLNTFKSDMNDPVIKYINKQIKKKGYYKL